MKWKKVLLLVSSVVILTLAFSIGNSAAFLSAKTTTKTNSFVKGVPDVDIIENGGGTPSSSYSVDHSTKQVAVKNTGTIYAYVRVMLVPSYKFSDSSGVNTATAEGIQFAGMPQSISGNSFVMGDLTLNLFPGTGSVHTNIWSDNWFYVYDSGNSVGYFYYKNALAPQATTTLLLNSVTSDTDYNNLQIDVIADSIQSDGGAVTDVWGDFVQENQTQHTIAPKT